MRQYYLRVSFGRPFLIQNVYGRIPKTMEEYREAAQKAMEQVYARENNSQLTNAKTYINR